MGVSERLWQTAVFAAVAFTVAVYLRRWLTASSTGFGRCVPLSHASRLYAALATTVSGRPNARSAVPIRPACEWWPRQGQFLFGPELSKINELSRTRLFHRERPAWSENCLRINQLHEPGGGAWRDQKFALGDHPGAVRSVIS